MKQPLSPDLEARLENCPTGPGVYLMKDEHAKVIYVGKAKNLRSRVRSYFQDSHDLSPKTQHLVLHIADIEFLRVESEIEALLLENNLIKKWKPKYNIRLKDDKTYPYIRIDTQHRFPRAYVARRQLKGDGSEYFGPYVQGSLFRELLKAAPKIFKLRDCRDHEFSNRSRPCMSYEIGQCTGPCVGLVTPEAYADQVQEYRTLLKGDTQALELIWSQKMEWEASELNFEKAAEYRDRLQILKEMQDQGQRIVDTSDLKDRDVWAIWPEKNLETEDFLDGLILQFRSGKLVGRHHWSLDLRDLPHLDGLYEDILLQYYLKHPAPECILLDSHFVASVSLPDLSLAIQAQQKSEQAPALELSHENESLAKLHQLAHENIRGWHEDQKLSRDRSNEGLEAIARLADLPAIPRRMECVDISNFQGEANVASCVVFIDGKPDKNFYRHYKIQSVQGQDDFASMKELMSRRYGKPDSPRPDLLVVDGGRGQLASVMSVLTALGCDFPVIGLAKARTQSDFQSSEVKTSEERIFLPNVKNDKKIKDLRALKILTHIRDEAHRFAIEFHRLQRSKNRGL